MEILISNKSQKNPFIFVKARRCGSNSLDAWLKNNIGKENYINLSGDNEFINYSVFNCIDDDIMSGYKTTFCRNPYTRVIAGYLADIFHITPSLGVNINDLNHPNQSPQELITSVGLPMHLYKFTDDKDIHIEAFTKFLDAQVEYLKTNTIKYQWQSDYALVFRPLWDTVLDKKDDNINFFDKIVKQENIEEDWVDVSTKILGKNSPLPRVNNFKERHPQSTPTKTSDFLYLLDYNNNKNKIAYNWKKDFELFGYTT